MKRIPIIEEIPQGTLAHPDASKPLSAFHRITAVCEDCGHTKELDRDALAAMSAVPTFGVLWRHAYCAPCRALGARRGKDRIMLHGEIIAAPKHERIEWSKKAVFSDKRSDPTPNLPRRNVFDRRIPERERMTQ